MTAPSQHHRPGAVAVISLAQLFGTSLWFSANSVTEGLMLSWGATVADIGTLTNAVQIGFIAGTLIMALGGLADRFPASVIFVISALAGAAFNLGFALIAQDVVTGAAFRFLVGLSLAGIYPIGMKLIVSWAPDRVGQSLALLVAMLTLGTALPHLLRSTTGALPWHWVVAGSSGLAIIGAALIARLGDGPDLPRPARRARRPGARHRPAVMDAFAVPAFRAAALGYFGHMWELYAFWTLVPLLVGATGLAAIYPALGVAGLSFLIIGTGALGCLAGGRLATVIGSARVALASLILSGACAVGVAAFWQGLPPALLLGLLLVWGASVVADSPQFSALSARASPRDAVAASLAIQNAVGFAITVASITLTMALFQRIGPAAVWLLVPGPVIGVLGFLIAGRPGR
ncbi:MAG: MFS transporter [Paracoccus hibiscisoli]|uniref:MFS transporter n=1 Tax=Paracoccus hibiscisoli TaxID=2023261 RepID=UPI00391D0072